MKLKIWPVLLPVLLSFGIGNYWMCESYAWFSLSHTASQTTWIENVAATFLLLTQIPSFLILAPLGKFIDTGFTLNLSLTLISTLLYTVVIEVLILFSYQNNKAE